MKRLFSMFAALGVVAVLGGCAHPVSLNSDLSRLAPPASAKLDKAIALNIPADVLTREVITPGGGGDKISYQPYRDLESGLYMALSQQFSRVTKVTSPTDPKVAAEGLHYVLTPRVTTTSSSPSLFTWPPTQFTILIEGRIQDAQGKPVAEVRAYGDGRAEFDEFKSDFSLAAKRAAEDVLNKFVKALEEVKLKLR